MVKTMVSCKFSLKPIQLDTVPPKMMLYHSIIIFPIKMASWGYASFSVPFTNMKKLLFVGIVGVVCKNKRSL